MCCCARYRISRFVWLVGEDAGYFLGVFADVAEHLVTFNDAVVAGHVPACEGVRHQRQRVESYDAAVRCGDGWHGRSLLRHDYQVLRSQVWSVTEVYRRCRRSAGNSNENKVGQAYDDVPLRLRVYGAAGGGSTSPAGCSRPVQVRRNVSCAVDTIS